MQDHVLDNLDVDPISVRFERDEKNDIQTALQWTTDLADKLNTLHPKAFNYAVWALHKM